MLWQEYSFPPPTDNSDIILLNHMCVIKKNNNIRTQNLLGAESRTCKQSSSTNAKAERICLVCLGKMLMQMLMQMQMLGVHGP